ncbi:pentapeptide repeat-containing protein [Streptomyces sp. NBC_01207]|uniref:pentapeptide repeat-containing protein n=1 Tax=Streptomyces sp. NBC_01207 TaxID=2903772 RepID=UPI002E109F0B|nr:pentapeptide repeat-containing protein [Streptomyces sp. NBC_01207]
MQLVGLVAVSLPGLAALAALLFTWMQVGQATKELRISEQGQITGRFNAAIGNLGSQSMDVRLGGIYALQRIMEDSARDHPTVVSVLAAFAQQHAGSSTDSLKQPMTEPEAHRPKADVRAATAVLAKRRADRDSGAVVDLGKTDLRGLFFTDTAASIKLPRANFSHADLRWASLTGADLREASFSNANLEHASLDATNLRGATFQGAKLPEASLSGADLRGAVLECTTFLMDVETGRDVGGSGCADLQRVVMEGADLRNAKMADSDLRGALLKGTDFRGADLSRADFRDADLSRADFRGATLTGVKLAGATRDGARGLP